MAYKALYRKYRPQTFSDVVGQDHIVETLKGELASNKISHAYLFTGTRGTGKTSCAKILAKAVNCQDIKDGDPCLSCDFCNLISSEEATDIVEIDAASNTGVDDIRVLRDQIVFSPTSLKYRVYIIDEVHMLSTSAFNALLKTLEEPPEHAIFILATTEVHKLPATILSRCQRFDFRRIEPSKICERIKYIADKENFKITDEAATLIAAAADGGMRDALSILDLCLSGTNDITEETVTKVCGMSGNEYLNKLSDSIIAQDTEAALTLIDELHRSSVDMLRLCNELSAHFRDIMVVKTVSAKTKPVVCSSEQLKVLEKKAETFDIKDVMRALTMLSACLSGMQNSDRRSILEMTVIKLCTPSLCQDYDSLEKRVRNLESGRTVIVEEPEKKQEKKTPAPKKQEEEPLVTEEKPAVEEKPKVEEKGNQEPINEWKEIMKILSKTCPPIHGVLDGSKAYINGAYLLIDAPNPMFRSFIKKDDSIYKTAIRKAANEVLGKSYRLGPYKQQTVSADEDPLKALSEKLKNLEIPNKE
ncbi:MAG: DNA polymerase III subunit gamma/tau [Clostridia bacterium]|nr:DNA polymerase III subunit gamma/tau [Clostridia bacterium]